MANKKVIINECISLTTGFSKLISQSNLEMNKYRSQAVEPKTAYLHEQVTNWNGNYLVQRLGKINMHKSFEEVVSFDKHGHDLYL